LWLLICEQPPSQEKPSVTARGGGEMILLGPLDISYSLLPYACPGGAAYISSHMRAVPLLLACASIEFKLQTHVWSFPGALKQGLGKWSRAGVARSG
jgi:hypothetical protein